MKRVNANIVIDIPTGRFCDGDDGDDVLCKHVDLGMGTEDSWCNIFDVPLATVNAGVRKCDSCMRLK